MGKLQNPWIQTATGIALDLMAPTSAMINFDIDIAEALARLPRFTGHVRSGPYSVAQHCCLAADAALEETRDARIAAYVLLHDAHEAYIGDIATPVAAAMAVHSQNSQIPCAYEFRDAYAQATASGLRRMKMTLDGAIHAAAGLPWTPEPHIGRLIKSYDIRMLAAEKRQLLGTSPQPWAPEIESAAPIRMVGKIGVWPWTKAAEQWRRRAHQLLPALAPRSDVARSPASTPVGNAARHTHP